jgi:signal transduction histidine kinase
MKAPSLPHSAPVPTTSTYAPVPSWALGMVAVAAAGVALVAGVTAWRVPGLSAMSDSVLATALIIGAGIALVIVGLEHARRGQRRRAGALLAAAGVLWLLREWASPAIGSSTGFTIGLVFGWLAPPAMGHALLVFGRSHLRLLDAALVVAGYVIFGIGLGLLPALTFDAADAGCAFCPPDLIAVAPSVAWSGVVTQIGSVLGAGWSVGLALLLLATLVAGAPAVRRLRGPLFVPGALFALAVGSELGRSAILNTGFGNQAPLLELAEAALLTGVAVGASLEWMRVLRSRNRVARVVTELGSSPPVGGLRDALVSALRDPGLRLAYPLPDGGQVDAAGQRLDLSGEGAQGRAITPIVRDGEIVALIDHRADVLQSSEMMAEVIRAARLGLEHERLQAVARAQLADLTAARKRIVEAASGERQRLERDLHDGAQQRLITIAVNLRLLGADASDTDERSTALIGEAGQEIALAIDELREVARGLYPSVLTDEGLAAAVESLAEGATTPVRVGDVEVDPLDAPIAEAAYALVSEVVHLGAGAVDVRATRDAGTLRVMVQAEDIPAEMLIELADRIGAVDGTFSTTRSHPGRTELVAEIPCAS